MTANDPRWMEVAGQGIQIEHELRKQLLTIEARTINRCVLKVELFIVNNRISGEVQALLSELRALKEPAQ